MFSDFRVEATQTLNKRKTKERGKNGRHVRRGEERRGRIVLSLLLKNPNKQKYNQVKKNKMEDGEEKVKDAIEDK